LKPIFLQCNICFSMFYQREVKFIYFPSFEYTNDQSLCYNFTQIYFIKSSNEKVLLSTILTNQIQKYLFATFIIPKFFKFCIQFYTNPMENTIVSKWNLNKNESTCVFMKNCIFLYLIFFHQLFLYKIPCIHHLIRK